MTTQHHTLKDHSLSESEPMRNCSHCNGLLHAALEASKAYHDLLGALEAADIHHDNELAYYLKAEEAKSASTRNHSITALRYHERTHAKKSQ